ncbi:MAG: hypothetical protein KAY37_02535, partial [Phycisphaerae bacterium]|nr:hypothetical protein [Phycisphaerae bacterium]
AQTAATPPPPPAPVVIEAATPSFAGRTAHAGLSFLGKLLLLIGLVVAVGQGAFRQSPLANDLCAEEPDVRPLIEHGIPPGAILMTLVLGSLFLIVARRKDGLRHFFRGCLGCACTLWGAVVAIAWGTPVMQILFADQDLSRLQGPGMWGTLVMMALSFGAGVLLLLWPKAEPNKPIVI